MKQYDITLPKVEAAERNLYLCKGVNQESIEEITKGIVKINEEDDQYQKIYDFHGFPFKRQPIKVYLDTYGGFVYQTFGLVSVMERSKTPVHTIVTGCAMSAGFIILVCGHKRFAYELSTPLYHQASSGVWGTIKEIQDKYMEAKRIQKMMEDIVVRRTKITRPKLQEIYDTQKDWYMTAKEAKRLGVVDQII